MNNLLSDRHGQPHPQLGPLDSLVRVEISADPYAVLSWLYRSDWGKLLGELAATNDQLTHATLDALPPRRHVQYLRAVLVNTGALPPRLEDLDSTPLWSGSPLSSGISLQSW